MFHQIMSTKLFNSHVSSLYIQSGGGSMLLDGLTRESVGVPCPNLVFFSKFKMAAVSLKLP